MRRPTLYALTLSTIALMTQPLAHANPPVVPTVTAERSPAVSARIVSMTSLDATGASGVAHYGKWTFVVQDNSTLLAAVSPGLRVEPLRLFDPIEGADTFYDAFKNKGLKPDLEAICSVRVARAEAAAFGYAAGRARTVDALVAIGSGSAPERRDRIAVVFPNAVLAESHVAAIQARGLYARLRADENFTGGGQLNIEGAVSVHGGRSVRLYNRGNGRKGSVTSSVDLSTRDLLAYLAQAKANPDAPFTVALERPMRYELGTSNGFAISIGDAIALPAGARHGEIVLAAFIAEETTDATVDGPTSATQLGLHLPDGRLLVAPLMEDSGPSARKIEGIVIRKATWQRGRLTLDCVGVVDADSTDPAARSTLLVLELVYEPSAAQKKNHG